MIAVCDSHHSPAGGAVQYGDQEHLRAIVGLAWGAYVIELRPSAGRALDAVSELPQVRAAYGVRVASLIRPFGTVYGVVADACPACQFPEAHPQDPEANVTGRPRQRWMLARVGVTDDLRHL